VTEFCSGADGQAGRFSEEKMLRRVESISLDSDPEEIEVISPSPKFEPSFVPKVERRKSERRGMDALRDEALRNLISRVEDRNFGGMRSRVRWGRGMKPSRILLLVVAVMAGGLAAFLATQQAAPVPVAAPVAEIVQPAKTQILVAKQTIGIGQRLSPASLEWQDWPVGAMRPEYINVATTPGAIAEMAGSVARVELFAGEPIRQEKLAPAGGGFLSAILDKGMRGVSVSVSAESASGGFIVPNDHVDVVLTRASSGGQDTQTILSNVRVLAINARLGETNTTSAPAAAPTDPAAEVFAGQAIATLELDQQRAEVISNAAGIGKLSLVLRSTADATEPGSADERAANAAIRLSSPFWTAGAGNSQSPH
jgi:pilus assembly protein CpaB